jgi:hypothetical protein
MLVPMIGAALSNWFGWESALRLFIFDTQWPVLLLVLPLGLGLVVLLLDGVLFLEAARRSISTVVRQLPVCLMLAGLFFLGLVLLYLYREVAAARFVHTAPEMLSLSPSPAGFALQFSYGALAALLGVWLALAQFLWYREASPAPAISAPNGVALTEG